MILIDGKPIQVTRFPDGTSSVRFNPLTKYSDYNGDYRFSITWKYDGDEECMLIWYIVKHIRERLEDAIITLSMPYIPNARMDRVKACDEIFTLKWFAEFINSLRFSAVFVEDPHSDVSVSLINRVRVLKPEVTIQRVLEILHDENPLICFPDEGAAKRYSSGIGMEYVFCIKHRDWRSGKIERLELTTPIKVNGRNILIVDDICSRGGTFTYTAKALRDAGAKNVYLYVTHCENTIEDGTVLTDGLIKHVFTTDSIYRGSNERITLV